MNARGKTFFIDAGGQSLRVRTLEGADGDQRRATPTLIFLHDALGCIEQWRDFPAAMAEATGLPALLYDRCGSGGSAPLPGLRTANYLDEEVRCLAELLEVCGVSRPILVGHSDGATIALMYAAKFPQKPLAVISEAAHVFVEEVTLQGIRQAVVRYRETDLRARLKRYHGEKADALFAAWSETWLIPGFHDWSIVEQLSAIHCPVLALQGETDEYGTLAQLTAICEQVSGESHLRLLPDCGHVPHHQARSRVLDEMLIFLGDVLCRAGDAKASATIG